jgi:hypothetical protein
MGRKDDYGMHAERKCTVEVLAGLTVPLCVVLMIEISS